MESWYDRLVGGREVDVGPSLRTFLGTVPYPGSFLCFRLTMR